MKSADTSRRYHPYNQSAAEADILRWRKDDLPLDIWGLDMDWRVWANGMEGKGYTAKHRAGWG